MPMYYLLGYSSNYSDKTVSLSVFGNENDNADADSNNIIFTIKDKRLYVSVITLSAKDNQKLSKLLSKGFERSMYCNEYNTESENKYLTNNYSYFLESNFVGDTDCFFDISKPKW